ncbi:hypothetical protein QCA50_010848 [Cerrena zonata]|uniref:Uncharacterized protein n=1 Tax=Cerrena zonata TaxID=2478898 RepID=A0AAW0FZ47_9APHY
MDSSSLPCLFSLSLWPLMVQRDYCTPTFAITIPRILVAFYNSLLLVPLSLIPIFLVLITNNACIHNAKTDSSSIHTKILYDDFIFTFFPLLRNILVVIEFPLKPRFGRRPVSSRQHVASAQLNLNHEELRHELSMNILTPMRVGNMPLFKTLPTILLSTRRASSSKARKQSGGGTKTGSPETPKPEYGPKRSPVDVFFARYSSFKHKRTKPLPDQFGSLCRKRCEELKLVKLEDEHLKALKNKLTTAMADELYLMYGRTESRKAGWRRLCCDAGIDPVPNTPKECRKEIEEKYINIVDLLSAKRGGRPIVSYKNLNELAKQTRRPMRMFPSRKVKGAFSALLHRLPPTEHRA